MLEQRILDFFHEVSPAHPDDKLLVAVSGGPDSAALLHLLLMVRDTLGVGLEVAHLDHGLREKAGESDSRFVSKMAEREGLTLHSRRVDVPGLHAEEGGSIEALARRERYAFLNEARAVAGARWIVTGHTADDQVETFLMNLLRGAGPRGLGGMLPVGPGPMCRPLLESWREEIISFLEANDLPYRLDPTNADTALTRNRIRHRLVPILKRDFGSSVLRTLARESQLMNDLDEFLSLESDRVLKRVAHENDLRLDRDEIRLLVAGLKTYPRVMQRSALRAALEDLAGGLEEITLAHIDALLDLVHRKEGSGEIHLPHRLLARREYEHLVLRVSMEGDDVHPSPEASAPLDLARPGELRWGRCHLKWSLAPVEAARGDWAESPERSFFDVLAPVAPVYLRAMRPGDRLEPKGMEGSQKVSDLFINRKVPRHLRTRIPLLCDNGGPEDGERILWVVGQRRSRHAPVDPETSQVVLFEAETIV
jgi:tRNA(Ile)-lysidine synthase